MRRALRGAALAAVVAGLVVGVRFVSTTPPPPDDEVAPAVVVAPVAPVGPTAPAAPEPAGVSPEPTSGATRETGETPATAGGTTSPEDTSAPPGASPTGSSPAPDGDRGDGTHVSTVSLPPVAALPDDHERDRSPTPGWTRR